MVIDKNTIRNLFRFIISLAMLPLFLVVIIPMVFIMKMLEDEDPDFPDIHDEMIKDMLALGWGWFTFKDTTK